MQTRDTQICIHTSTCIRTYTYMHTYIYVHAYVCTYTVCICTYTYYTGKDIRTCSGNTASEVGTVQKTGNNNFLLAFFG